MLLTLTSAIDTAKKLPAYEAAGVCQSQIGSPVCRLLSNITGEKVFLSGNQYLFYFGSNVIRRELPNWAKAVLKKEARLAKHSVVTREDLIVMLLEIKIETLQSMINLAATVA